MTINWRKTLGYSALGLVVIGSILIAIFEAGDQDTVDPNTLKLGDYVSQDYLKELAKTRSPLKAYQKNNTVITATFRVPDYLKKSDSANYAFYLESSFFFHEQGYDFGILKSAEIELLNASEKANNDFSICISSSTSFTINCKFSDGYSLDDITFEWVGDANKFITSKALEGIYADDKGNKIIFGKDCKVKFPNMVADYEVLTDLIQSTYDEVLINKKHYPFEWKNNNKLVIYDEQNPKDVGVPIMTKPKWVLRKSI